MEYIQGESNSCSPWAHARARVTCGDTKMGASRERLRLTRREIERKAVTGLDGRMISRRYTADDLWTLLNDPYRQPSNSVAKDWKRP